MDSRAPLCLGDRRADVVGKICDPLVEGGHRLVGRVARIGDRFLSRGADIEEPGDVTFVLQAVGDLQRSDGYLGVALDRSRHLKAFEGIPEHKSTEDERAEQAAGVPVSRPWTGRFDRAGTTAMQTPFEVDAAWSRYQVLPPGRRFPPAWRLRDQGSGLLAGSASSVGPSSSSSPRARVGSRVEPGQHCPGCTVTRHETVDDASHPVRGCQ